MNPFPPITKYLLWAIGIAFVVQLLAPQQVLLNFALWPLGDVTMGGQSLSLFRPWQVLTYGLLHGDFMHLFLNAIGLFQFGGRIEDALGRKRYIQFALACTIGAALCQLVVAAALADSGSPIGYTVGASGFVYGLLLAYGLMFPHERVMLMLPPVEMSARTMAFAFGGLALLMGVFGTGGGIAHFAHLGGMLFGFLLLRYWSAQRGRP